MSRKHGCKMGFKVMRIGSLWQILIVIFFVSILDELAERGARHDCPTGSQEARGTETTNFILKNVSNVLFDSCL